MKPLSEQLSSLSIRAKQVEDDVAAAKTEAVSKIEARRAEVNAKVESGLKAMSSAAQNAKSDASSRLTALKDKISADVAHVKQRVAQETTKIDAKIASSRADSYENEAALSIEYALYSIDAAEAAVLDAIAARAEANSYNT